MVASRPRVTRWGVYYSKKYREFRKRAEIMIDEMYVGEPLQGAIAVVIVCVCNKPNRPKNGYPHGDIDNFCKGILDAANGRLFVDDSQIVTLTALKRYAHPDMGYPRIEIIVDKVEIPLI